MLRNSIDLDDRILRLPEVRNKVGLARSTIYLLMSKNDFPASIKLGPRCVGWLESDIINWINSRTPK